MAQDNRARLKEWLESGQIRLQPLTFPQRELWEVSPVPPGDASNNICAMIHLRGRLTQEGSLAAFQKVVDRQEAFRVSFLPGKAGPLQMIRRDAKANLSFEDASSSRDLARAVEECAARVFDEPFDLLQGPLYRSTVLRLSPEEHVLVFAIHHAIADGWTLGVFVQDLFAAYLSGKRGGGAALEAVPLSYSEWGAGERAFWSPEELAKRAGYWRENLADAPRLWSPPADPVAVSGKLRRSKEMVEADVTKSVREVARKNGATLFSTLLAAFQIAMARWTGADDITVGTPVANRNRQAVRETMGYCAGIVPLRGRVDPEVSFSEAVRAVHASTLDSFANAMPFAELVKAVGEISSPGYNPVFETRFALQNHPVPDAEMAGFSVKLRMRSTGTARFDLACEVTEEGDALEVVWLFREGLFALETADRLCHLYPAVLAELCRTPEVPVSTLLPNLP